MDNLFLYVYAYTLAYLKMWMKFNPDQPRVPAGDSRGGEWTSGGVSKIDKIKEYIYNNTPSWMKARVEYKDEYGEEIDGGYVLGEYNDKTKTITVFKNATELSEKELQGVLSHEITHHVFHVVGDKKFDIVYKIAEIYGSKNAGVFKENDGISGYSAYIWSLGNDTMQGIEETLCEVARNDALGEGWRTPKIWRDLYNAFVDEAKK